MLCHLCETFLANILAQDFSNWKRVKHKEGWYTFKHGNHATVKAMAEGGCDLCNLFNRVRSDQIPNYESLGEKWHIQAASIDCEYDYEAKQPGQSSEQGKHSNTTFHLLTVAPEMSWIAFEIFKPEVTDSSDGYCAADNLDWALAVPKSPTSPQTIRLARFWIDCCLESHSACARPARTPLPTRIIDIGGPDGAPTPRLRVNRGELGRYVTLSHCWGIGQRLTLTKRNLNAFQQSVPFNQLPRTFQDAIEIIRLLGLRYLWIDALCIVQDDQQDWRRESASMCAVFENALFSISALSAEDTHSGILHDRRHSQIWAELNNLNFGVRTRLDLLQSARERSRLESRAWCLQERLLPRAILHIAPQQLHWECRTGSASESFSELAPNELKSSKELSTPHASTQGKPDYSSINKNWLSLVSTYSARQVTRASDRLPAIAGLADKARKELGIASYMEGLWSHDLHAGLLWRRQSRVHGQVIPSRDRYPVRVSSVSKDRPRRPIASSWSWASTNDAVNYPLLESFSVRSLSKADAEFDANKHKEDEERAKSIGVLHVEGLVKRGSCKRSHNSSEDPEQASFRLSGSLLLDEGMTCYLDYVDDPISKGCYVLRIANWTSVPSKRNKEEKTPRLESVAYLILERIQDDSATSNTSTNHFGIFKRIGVGYDDPVKVDKIFSNAERRQLHLT